ncbi:hypothetical protein GCK72_007851 [Caenorhabditis remanei]|uniref:Uncharacterized protein n=1 Tax=Caenorhabditis remanei TaxID=31234 RepID=A0A6A5HQ00_CAERE|nr:hypothetical protein GCK72_007851 [Caenorhabditis remanei]KAF1767892.1 hypothetical protein GCK72_007851 [Caenorhabditis remanei]
MQGYPSMASTSTKSAVARITGIPYSDIDELETTKPAVTFAPPTTSSTHISKSSSPSKEAPPPPPPSSTSSGSSEDFARQLALFESGTPLKCVRIPKREQHHAKMVIYG